MTTPATSSPGTPAPGLCPVYEPGEPAAVPYPDGTVCLGTPGETRCPSCLRWSRPGLASAHLVPLMAEWVRLNPDGPSDRRASRRPSPRRPAAV